MNKYNTGYYQCSNCLFIQTDEPHWLRESYSSAITALDIGLVQRNIQFSNITVAIINLFFKKDEKFIDFGGGYGMFVRMMRDKGFDFYRQDMYCENLFAKNFDVTDLPQPVKFELLTAFEVFEHLPDPLQTIDELLKYSDNILFSTTLQPIPKPTPETWWYILPEIGQHISLFHLKTLEYIAQKKNLFLFSNGKNTHLLTKKKINPLLFKLITKERVAKLINPVFINGNKSLTEKDLDYLKMKSSI
ncbi:MAG TPA: class I SAM-dependent methyltransferase [Flavisolibacter sp.]|nr:class I SAM-dependent methyltransferase [Flavisolibacter sp.]